MIMQIDSPIKTKKFENNNFQKLPRRTWKKDRGIYDFWYLTNRKHAMQWPHRWALETCLKCINEHFKNYGQKLPDFGVTIMPNFSFSQYYNSFREFAGNSASIGI